MILTKNLSKDPEVVIVTDAPSEETYAKRLPCSVDERNVLLERLNGMGLRAGDVGWVAPSPPIPADCDGSDKRTKEFLKYHRGAFLEQMESTSPSTVLVCGKTAAFQVYNKNMPITKIRGVVDDSLGFNVLPVFSPRMVMIRPEVEEVFDSDLRMLDALRDADYDLHTFTDRLRHRNYRWVTDLTYLLDDPPKHICLDIETKGDVRWHRGQQTLLVQLCYRKGESIAVPLDIDYWNNPDRIGESSCDLPRLTPRLRSRIIKQLRQLLGNPRVQVVGHNLKFDLHGLRRSGIEVANWKHDTIQLTFVVDENMENKGLSEGTRRWVPEMAGYSDEFDRTTDKSHMEKVDHDPMLMYGCGDTDAGFRLAHVLVKEAKKDRRNYRCYEKIQMPALRTFFPTERKGLPLHRRALGRLHRSLVQRCKVAYDSLIERMPAEVKRAHLNDPKFYTKTGKATKTPEEILSFGRDDLVKDIMFSPQGFDLTPVEFTKTTRRLAPERRVPSVSKTHLPMFIGESTVPMEVQNFIQDMIAYKEMVKMRDTYVGKPSTVTLEPVKQLKNGGYGKPVKDAFEAAEVRLPPPPKTKKRRRRRISAKLNTKNKRVNIIASAATTKGRQFRLSDKGTVFLETVSEAKGFYQHLPEEEPEGGIDMLHPSFFCHRAVTGRTSAADPPLQQIPKRSELAGEFRACFQAPKGWKLIECDLSQAELRFAAWMANERRMIELYRNGGDLHAMTAASGHRVDYDEFRRWKNAKVDSRRFQRYKEWRQQAKAENFGFIYGMWYKSFVKFAKIDYKVDYTEEEAKERQDTFFETYPGLPEWHKAMKDEVAKHGQVRALHGALRHLQSIRSIDQRIRNDTERQAVNSPIQRIASDMGLMGMVQFGKWCNWETQFPVGFIHDAVVALAKDEGNNVVETASALLSAMSDTRKLQKWFGIRAPLPIGSDAEIGDNLNQMEELDSGLVVPMRLAY